MESKKKKEKEERKGNRRMQRHRGDDEDSLNSQISGGTNQRAECFEVSTSKIISLLKL